MRWKLITLVFLAATSLVISNSANASVGGVEQTNNSFVVGFTYSDNGVPSLCSGALVAPDVIATARHCVVNRQGIFGTDYVFSAPGAKLDAPIDGTKVPTGIKRVIVPQQSPTTGLDFRLDVAFIITNKAFASGTPIAFGTAADVAGLSDASVIAGYGYGAVFETGATYSSLPRKFELSWKGSYLVDGTTSYYELVNSTTGACRGDSGGPITLKRADGNEVLIGAVSGAGEVANGCATKLADNLYHLRITAFHPYVSQIPAATPSPAPKIKKIICVKGSKKITVKGVNPKCPKGYKLKK